MATSAARATLTCDHAYGLWSLEQTLAKRRIFNSAKVPRGASGVNKVRRETTAIKSCHAVKDRTLQCR